MAFRHETTVRVRARSITSRCVNASSLLALLVAACASPLRATFEGLDRAELFAPCWAQLERRFGAENVKANPESGQIEIGAAEQHETVVVEIRSKVENQFELEVRSGDADASDLARFVLEDLELAILAAHPNARIVE